MKNKFNFYEIVKISSDKPSLRQVNNSEGAVLGMAQNEETGDWSYGVSVYSDGGLGWHIMEDDLVTTGKKGKREDFYTGESIKVQVDPHTGEGKIAEDD